MLPNLGLDILGVGIMQVVEPLLGAKLIGGLVVFAPFAGVLYLAHALHGRITVLNVLMAGFVAYSHILIWGFSNFLLGLGVLLAATGYWIASQDRPARQLLVTVGLGLVLFLIHGLAFALWGLLLGLIELSLAFQSGKTSVANIARRMGRLLLIAVVPVLLFLQTNTAGGGAMTSISNLFAHAESGTLAARLNTEVSLRLDSILRVAESTWRLADYGIGFLLWGGLIAGFMAGIWQIDRRLRLAVMVCVVLVFIFPPNLFGVGHLRERIPLLLLALLAASLSFKPGINPKYQTAALAAVAILLLVRNLVLSVSWYQDGQVYSSYLEALSRHETGFLGAAFFTEGTENPGVVATSCMPLPFLMTFDGTAVPTFANATQQPIRIIGALSGVQTAAQQIVVEGDHTVPSALAKLAEVQTDTVIVCSVDSFRMPVPGFNILAADAPWTLYQRIGSQ